MASGTFATPPPAPPVQAHARGPAGGFDKYVEDQLRKTRTQVKVVDIVSNLLLLVCGALAYMLVVALVDHWLVTLSFTARMLALAVLVGGCAWWLYARIMPLIVRRINPVYAALTIERAEPSLKNSLINFLLLRGERGKVHEVVYQALGQRAATDLSHMPAETVVDYNPLIRIGYVLAGLVIFGAAYKILSPKDPVQSVARVMAPWADIARASRVSIDDVRPGEAKIFQGDHVEVSAILRGTRASDNVRVIYSTVDGQVLDQEVTMLTETAGLRHLAKIPADEMGAQSSLQYKLVAGDAETKWYNVEVAPAPHVLVTKVEYDPPAYTKLAAEESAQGDISGLEGTKVTLHARANREIESAYLEFDPFVDPKAAKPESAADARSLRITQIDGQDLQVSFQLRLDDKRDAAWHQHYTIRYKSKEGHRNKRPIIHTISVKPDLAPLAEILSPSLAEAEKTVPQNRMVEIEAKGIDLDFALTKLRLVAVSGGRDVLDIALLDAPNGQSGQVIKKLEFTPSHYALAVGDVVEYWAVAEDNRTSPRSGKPEPNITSSTPTYRLIIGPPVLERAKPEEDETKPTERGEGEEPESSGGGAPQQSPMNGSGEDGESGNSGQKKPNENDMGGGESGESGSSGGAQEGSEQGVGEGEKSSSSENGEGEGEGEGSESSEGGTAGNRGALSNEPSESNSGEAGEGGTESSSEGSESNGSQSGGSKAGGTKPSEGGSESNEPLANDGSQDGDAFDKIQQHRQQQESQNSDGASGSQQGGSSSETSGDAQEQDGGASQQNGGASGSQNSEQNAGQQNSKPQNSGQQNSGSNSAGQSGEQQGQKPSGQQNGNQSGGAQSGGEKQPNKQPGEQQSGGSQGGSQQGEKPEAGQQGGGKQGGEQGGSQQNQDQGQKNGGEQGEQQGSQSGGQQQGEKPQQGSQGGNQENQGGQNDQGQNKNASGGQEGGQPQGGAKPEGDKPSNSGGGQQPKESSGGQGQNDKSGAGKESQEGGGSPQSQAEKPQQKNGGEQSGGQQGGGQKKEEGGKSPGGSNKNSQSQGDSGGDRSGGGEQGGGQGAKKPGNDSAGSSSAGEQGDGAANEPGSGESGNRGGGDQVSDSPTGRSGEQTGEGSSSGQANDGGEQPRPQSGNKQGGESSSSGKQPGGSRPKEGEQGEGAGEQISDTPGEGRGTQPTGGGKPADNHPSDTPLADIEPGADAANLDYARKSTDLTLEYLKNQKHNPDPKLLDELGWTKDDLAKFIDRWDRMQRDAKTDTSGSAKRKLDDSLRSLGLRPRTSQVRTDDAGGTRLTGQRETGARTRPPKSYADQYRAFSKFITPAKE